MTVDETVHAGAVVYVVEDAAPGVPAHVFTPAEWADLVAPSTPEHEARVLAAIRAGVGRCLVPYVARRPVRTVA